jgi:hypothetical protein
MKTLKFGLVGVWIFVAVTFARAQTVDDIINKHINAMGGKDKISSIKTVYTEGDVEVMGQNATMTTYILNGKAFKSETEISGSKIIQCYTQTGGWMINPMSGQTSAVPVPKEQLRGQKSQFQVGGPLFDYAAQGSKAELLGTEDFNGAKDYKIKLTTSDSAVVTYYIDPTTYYISKAVTQVNMEGQDAETTIVFSDYKKTDYGFVYPMTLQLTVPQGFTLGITIKKVEINKDIDPQIFDMPKS